MKALILVLLFFYWSGISCSRRRQRVIALNVVNLPLYGTIAPQSVKLSCENSGHANFVEIEEEATLFFACSSEEEGALNTWYLDTRCSNHMCGNKKLFSHLDESVHGVVNLGTKPRFQLWARKKFLFHWKMVLVSIYMMSFMFQVCIGIY